MSCWRFRQIMENVIRLKWTQEKLPCLPRLHNSVIHFVWTMKTAGILSLMNGWCHVRKLFSSQPAWLICIFLRIVKDMLFKFGDYGYHISTGHNLSIFIMQLYSIIQFLLWILSITTSMTIIQAFRILMLMLRKKIMHYK